jgi:hypothetical protein
MHFVWGPRSDEGPEVLRLRRGGREGVEGEEGGEEFMTNLLATMKVFSADVIDLGDLPALEEKRWVAKALAK